MYSSLQCNIAAPLRELTCHMRSQSVTCHPTQVDIPTYTPGEAGTRFSDPGGMQGWVDLSTAVKVCSSGPRLHITVAFATNTTVCCEIQTFVLSEFTVCIPCVHSLHCYMPSMLWRCWLGGRKGIQPVKKWVVGCWHGYLSAASCRLAYVPADATATHCLLLQ